LGAQALRFANDRLRLWIDPRQGALAPTGRPDRTRPGGEPQRALAHRDWRRDRDAVAAEQDEGQRDRAGDRGDAGAEPLLRFRTEAATSPPRTADSLRRLLLASREHPRRRRRRALPLARGCDQRAGGAEAIAGVLRDRALDHRIDSLRDFRLGVCLLARVGNDSGERLIEDTAERVDVCLGPDSLPPPLLRRHVLDRADDRATGA
jgi:hypothetical protein